MLSVFVATGKTTVFERQQPRLASDVDAEGFSEGNAPITTVAEVIREGQDKIPDSITHSGGYPGYHAGYGAFGGR